MSVARRAANHGAEKAPTMPDRDPPNPTGQWKRTGTNTNVEKAKQQDMRDFFGSGSSSAATQSSAASLPKAGTSADPIDAPEEPIHAQVPDSAEKHGGPAAPTPCEELPHRAGQTLSCRLSMLSPVLFGRRGPGEGGSDLDGKSHIAAKVTLVRYICTLHLCTPSTRCWTVP